MLLLWPACFTHLRPSDRARALSLPACCSFDYLTSYFDYAEARLAFAEEKQRRLDAGEEIPEWLASMEV